VAGRVALIAGASGGIGSSAARLLASKGYTCVLAGRDEAKLAEVAAGAGGDARVEVVPLTDGRAVIASAARIVRDVGVPDAIVNCAGAGTWKRVDETPPEEAVSMMAAPYFAAFNVTHAFLPSMLQRRRGVFVHIGSPASRFRFPASAGYSAARSALRSLNESLQADLRGTGVKSVHLVLGKVETEYFHNNPGVIEHIPAIARIIPTLAPDQAARCVLHAIERPSREQVHPVLLRLFWWCYGLTPWLVDALLGRG
jgi:NADP-dependent 3-hydroxy acid dehydrogenase YdfG